MGSCLEDLAEAGGSRPRGVDGFVGKYPKVKVRLVDESRDSLEHLLRSSIEALQPELTSFG